MLRNPDDPRPMLQKQQSVAQFNQALRPIFAKFDSDESGTVSVSELGKITTLMKLSLSPAELSKLVADADTDGSGDVSFDEFATLIRKQQAKQQASGVGGGGGDGDGGLAGIVAQANSMFGWLPSFSSWFSSDTEEVIVPQVPPTPSTPLISKRARSPVHRSPSSPPAFQPESLHADSMIMALSDGRRCEETSSNEVQRTVTPQRSPACPLMHARVTQ